MPLILRGKAAPAVAGLLFATSVVPCLAQARNPFSVGISEGGGSATGVTGWILAQQGWFEHQLSLGVRAARMADGAVWPLVAISFVYGVFHAAGPGHGKAVLTSYMVANERALRRGIGLSFLAALLQGLVAIALVMTLSYGLNATAQRMKDAASLVEWASFLAIALLGGVLVWRKGRALVRLWSVRWEVAPAAPMLFASGGGALALGSGLASARLVPAPAGSFSCVPADAPHAVDCPHCLGVDPATLGDRSMPLRETVSTVVAAGLRPCSGAILVLVFALSQGVVLAGILSVAAMSVGVALTTATLASLAVFFKATAQRVVGRRSRRAALFGAAVELAAAVVVLGAGLALLAGLGVMTGS